MMSALDGDAAICAHREMTTSSRTTTKRERPLELVLFGATGFTGRLVADHIAGFTAGRSAPLRWALAGRDVRKLEELATALRRAHPAASAPELVRADAQARGDLDALARRTRVVCSTAGPFAKYGSQLVGACADAGTDYCDITGEVHWVRDMIDAHHQDAVKSGARLVHCCGFDSIPSDLGAWALQQEMIARGGPASQITAYVERLKGTMSGGTIASIFEVAKAVSADRSVARRIAAPYALNPDPSYRGADRGDARGIGYDREAGALTMPFLMAATNTRVVRRAHALAGFPWGEDFRYTEVSTAPPTVKGALRAAAMTGGLGVALLAASSPRLRPLLEKRLPKPGDGPSEAERNAGNFRIRLVGKRDGEQLAYLVADQLDPGYGSTAKMLGQSALCLAFDPPGPGPAAGGSLTPSIAMGAALVRRLRAVGMTFELAE